MKTTKQTELPSGWEMLEFGDFTELRKSKYVPTLSESLRCLELEHFNQETGDINGWVDSSLQKSTKNVFKEGDVLFGKLRPYLKKYWKAEFDGVSSSEVWVLKPNFKICDNNFLFRLIQTNRFIQVANVSSGSKMPRADWDYVSSFPFILPPLPEQRAIANILSTWDTAIQTTQALISQKEQEKKWLMQNLLTGKKRLKGFSGEWKEYQLSCFIKEHKEKPLNIENYEIFTSAKKGLMKQSDYYGDNRITNREDVDYNVLPSGYLTYRSRSDDGIFTFNKNNFPETGLISGYYPVFKSFNGSTDFILEFINYNRQKLTKYAIGTSQLVLSFNALKNARFVLPEFEEQTAIAKVLQTADKEIELLKSKLEQQKLQKKGLMQVLLTGKVRVRN